MKKRWKRLLTLALCAGMLGLAAPATAAAAENTQSLMQASGTEGTVANVTYLDSAGKENTCVSAKVVTADDTSWGDEDDSKSTDVWYVVNQNVTINRRVSVTDKVHLILMNNCTLTVNGGISVTTDMQYNDGTKKLCIYEQPQIPGKVRGKLVATCATADVTIGADTGENGRSIYIYGGDIEASNTGSGAAIGSDQKNTGSVRLYGNSLKLTSASGTVMKIGNVWTQDGTDWKVTADDKGIEIGAAYWNNILATYCMNSKKMTFAPCTEHAYDRCVYKDENMHSPYCKWCGHTEGTTVNHIKGLDGKCACGVIETSYQMLDGQSGLKWCLPIESDSSSREKVMSGSWYVVQGNVSVASLYLSAQETNLIIADDSSLTVRTSIDKKDANQSFTIWGQSEGNGKLMAKSNSTFFDLTINSGELYVYDNYYSAITADNITLNRGKISAYSYRSQTRAFAINKSIRLDPASCWMVKYNEGYVWNTPEELQVLENPDIKTACTTYQSVAIEPNAEHVWNMDANGQKHVCKYCGKEHEKVLDHTGEKYIADKEAHTITRICQDELGLELPIILNPPAVSEGRTDIIYDGSEKEVQLTGDGAHGSKPEITYSYKAPGEDDYVPMADGAKPVNVGDYRATVSLTGVDNKKASVSIDFAIVWLPLENTVNAALTDHNGCAYTDDYWANKVTFTAPDGFTICDSVTGMYEKSFVYKTDTPAEGTVVTYYLQNDSGEVAKKSALVKIDNVAPKLTDVKQPIGTEQTLTDTSAVITFTGNDTGTYYYILKESAAEAPAAMTDFADKTVGKGTIWTARDGVTAGKMTADAGNKIELNGLKANTEYILYLAAADKAGNVSVDENTEEDGIVSVTFTTLTTTYVKTAPVLSGIYGEKLSAMLDRATASASVTAGKDSDVAVAGTWSVASGDIDRIPMVGTSGKYTLIFTPEDTNIYAPVTCEVTADVAKKPVTVVIEDKGRVYGEDDPVFTWSLATGEGFENNSLVGNDSLSDLCITLATTATKYSDAGTYAITGISNSTKYDVVFTGNSTERNSGVLTVHNVAQVPDMPKPAKKGTILTETKSGATYKVTGSDPKKPEVEYKAPKNKKQTKAVIPDTVTIDGVEYAVTSIANNAFKNNKKLTKVKVGKNVTSIGESAFSGCKKLSKVELDVNLTKIGKNAFRNCTKLKSITIQSNKLNKKNVGKGAFKGISAKAVFKVPKSKLASYKKLFRSKGLSKKARFKKY